MTLAWQPRGYWTGHYGVANEGNSVFQVLLSSHPVAFEAGMLAWIALFSLVVLTCPRRLALTVALAVSLGHAWGLSTWLVSHLPHGYWLALGLYIATAAAVVYTWDRYQASAAGGA